MRREFSIDLGPPPLDLGDSDGWSVFRKDVYVLGFLRGAVSPSGASGPESAGEVWSWAPGPLPAPQWQEQTHGPQHGPSPQSLPASGFPTPPTLFRGLWSSP